MKTMGNIRNKLPHYYYHKLPHNLGANKPFFFFQSYRYLAYKINLKGAKIYNYVL